MSKKQAYEVSSRHNSQSYGVWTGETPETAIAAMLDEAGRGEFTTEEDFIAAPVVDSGRVMELMRAAGIEGDQDWSAETTTYTMPNGDKVEVDFFDVRVL